MRIEDSYCLELAILFFHIGIVSYFDFLGPVVENHVTGPAKKSVVVAISSSGAVIIRHFFKNVKFSYVFIFFTVEVMAHRHLLLLSTDYGLWDLLFMISLDIVLINLMKGGNIFLVFVFSFLLWRLVYHKYIYSSNLDNICREVQMACSIRRPLL